MQRPSPATRIRRLMQTVSLRIHWNAASRDRIFTFAYHLTCESFPRKCVQANSGVQLGCWRQVWVGTAETYGTDMSGGERATAGVRVAANGDLKQTRRQSVRSPGDIFINSRRTPIDVTIWFSAPTWLMSGASATYVLRRWPCAVSSASAPPCVASRKRRSCCSRLAKGREATAQRKQHRTRLLSSKDVSLIERCQINASIADDANRSGYIS